MAGAKSNKRKRNATSHASSKKATIPITGGPISPPESDTGDPKNLSTLISEEEMEITVDTLLTLSEYPGIIKSKPCKALRAAVFDFRQACTMGVNTAADANLTSRVSAAIADGKYADALVSVAEMRIRNESPKLGALCRWVRDLDVISGVSLHDDAGKMPEQSKTKDNLERMRVLDSILRVVGPPDSHLEETDLATSGPIVQKETWNLRNEGENRIQMRESVLNGTISEPSLKIYQDKFKVIETTPGSERKPPNLHPAVIYLTDANTVNLSADAPKISHHRHPYVPNLSLMKDVFSVEECKSIIAATESIGFLPDAPIKEDGFESSILAHNVYWMIDQAFHDKLWERVQPFVPTHMDGRKAQSINRRFRVYRYVPGAEYRCHIDGAWPPSGIHPITKAYQYDSSPPDMRQSSLFTFLIYLNDEFEGGETTFFLPSLREGVLNAYPVKPVMGGVAMFPHGETKGALLHEGTGVTQGAKYIIRTDVEFDIKSRQE